MKRIAGKPLDQAWADRFDAFLEAVEADEISFEAQLPIARKFFWEDCFGYQVPNGYWIRHKCKLRECVNPSHAVLVKEKL